jgi:hypothetical protein
MSLNIREAVNKGKKLHRLFWRDSNSILISSKFQCRNQNFYFGFNFDVGISFYNSISESEFRFRHRNSNLDTRFQYQSRNFKAFFTEIRQNLSFDCLSDRLLSIISTNTFVESRYYDRNSVSVLILLYITRRFQRTTRITTGNDNLDDISKWHPI